MIPANEALLRLREGNLRYASGGAVQGLLAGEDRRRELLETQEPFAVVLGCSDSRVPAELVFDQGVGNLFVVRVAGNVAGSSQVGSVEFGASVLGARLVVVLGHSGCGAIRATLDQLGAPAGALSPHLQGVIELIRPAVQPLVGPGVEAETLMRDAVRANVRAASETLRRDPEVIDGLVRDEGLRIVGAEYSLESGLVEFLT